MFHNCLSHITTQNPLNMSIVPGLHAEPRVCTRRPLFRSCHRLLRRSETAVGSSSRLSVNNKTGGGKGMSCFYEIEEEVRDYELNQFGVVNLAVYNNYSEYGTYKLLENIGFDADIRLAVSEFGAKYIAPLKRKDKYMLKLRIVDYSSTRLFIEDHIVRLPNHEPILRGTFTLVHIDENLRPSRFTSSMVSKLNNFFLTQNKETE